MALNDEIADQLISHQIGLQRLSSATIRKIVALLNRVDARVVQRLLRDDVSEFSRRRQEELLKDIRRIVDSVYTDATGALQIELEDLAAYEVDYQLDMFRRVVPVELSYVKPGIDQIVAAVNARPFQGRLLKEWYKSLPDATFARLRDAIRMGFVEGRTIDQMVREIRGTKSQGYRDGILETTRRQAEATVRTAVNHTANVARSELYKRNRKLIKAVQWVSVLDGRTSAVCRGRDGKTYPPDSGPIPPAHINCRSATVPVLKSWRELGLKDLPPRQRASMNGLVAADQTYSDWLRNQPVPFQNEVLGVRKATLFRKGDIDLDRFTDKSGKEYTLDELRQREREAWEKAGL